MKSKSTCSRTSMLTLALSCMVWVLVQVQADHARINLHQCAAKYSQGSASKPCTVCSVCIKVLDDDKSTVREACTRYSYFYAYMGALQHAAPFALSGSYPDNLFCATKNTCSNFACKDVRPDRALVRLMSGCKCRCDASRYGQSCELPMPPQHSPHSFADVQNVVYTTNIYVTDFAAVYVYVYTKGVDMRVRVRTDAQDLVYDGDSCKTSAQRLQDLCDALFADSGLHPDDIVDLCQGGPTYDGHEVDPVCVVVVNVAFPKVKVSELNFKSFLYDEDEGKNTPKVDAKVVAKVEKVDVTVFNRIPDLNGGTAVLLSTSFGVTVVYKSKATHDDCPVMVSIPQFSKRSDRVPFFPRSAEISLTNLVVLGKLASCDHLGEPVTDWFLWVLRINHDEKNDQPVVEMLRAPTVTFAPFSLGFGKYKVKSLVRFVERIYHEAFAYCFFEIVPLPLHPLIFGGSLRYVYYKSNFDLISINLLDPNSPLEAQPKLKREWSCDDIDDRICDKITGYETSVTKYGPFKPGKSYNFTMAVQGPSLPLEFCHQIIMIYKDPIPHLLIDCLRNCGGKGFESDTREIFYFKVLHSNQTTNDVEENKVYNWTYSMNNSSFVDPHDIRQEEETPSWILIVNENSLKDNQKYTFKVTGGGTISGEAQLNVIMFKYTDTFHCTITPKSGIAVQTKFAIECSKADFGQSYQLSLNVYFYDKYNESDEFGRLLGSNFMESIDDIVLTRGTVMVHATNMFGQFQQAHVSVPLTFPSVTAEFVNQSVHTLMRLSENEGYDQKLSYISSLCDILDNEPSTKEMYVETFLELIHHEHPIDIVHLELLLFATQSAICNRNNCTTITLSDNGYKMLGKILSGIADELVKELQITAHGKSELPTFKRNLLYTSLLKCSGVFLSVKNKDLTDHESKTIDYNLYTLYKAGNLKVLNAMDRVNIALAIKNIPYIKHSAVRTELVKTWMKEDVPTYFTKGTKGNDSSSHISMSPTLAKSLKKVSSHVAVNVMAFVNDPYWWSQTEDVSTEVVSLSIGYTHGFDSYTSIRMFQYPIDIFLKKNDNQNVTVSGVVTQPDADNVEYNKDLAVSVHKIYVLKGEKLSLRFVDLQETDVFKVTVTKNLRPDYEMVLKGVEITYHSPWYHSPRNIKVTAEDDAVFVGILPGASVPANATRRYTFELQSARCQVWYDFLWDASGCSLGQNTTNEFLHCQCTHLSSVAGFLGVPINTINPLTDYKLFLTIPDNPFVLMFILMILLIYILLLIWSYVANNRDVLRTSIVVLEDNISSDYCGYLVIVFTGSRLYAGTTSHIGIILHGSKTSSRAHILKSSQRDTLTRNSDDWFLIYTPKHLGVISSIQLWSDHTGTYPNWFCDRVHVHDFTEGVDYSFLIGKWFGVTHLGARVESFTRPIDLKVNDHIVDFFLTNVVSGFRESHLWISILTKHPRSPMTRAQRVSIAMVALVTTLLGCILFYDVSLPEDEDVSEYSVTTREILISVYTLVISIAVTGVVFFAFSKSYTYVRPKKVAVAGEGTRRSAKMQESRVQVDSADTLRQRKRATRGFRYYIKKAIISLRQEEFYPVRANTGSKEKEQIIIHKVRLILSWVLCTCAILCCCFFTVWIGLKIGKNKSLLWLTSIGMSLAEDGLLMDPIKIVTIALLFGIVQTQLCDIYAYDPTIYEKRNSLTRHVGRDLHVHKIRMNPLYKPASMDRLEAIQDQQRIVKKWWSQIDIIDIVFSVVIIFFIIERARQTDYFHTNAVLSNVVFNRISSFRNLIPSPAINNASKYSMYLQDSVFSTIYCSQWYNKHQLSAPNDTFAETGWIKTLNHRMIGTPRLRQIRVHKESCGLPFALNNLSVYCNVLYSRGTEDTEFYSAQWNTYTTEYVDVIFEQSPWVYTFPDEVSAHGVAGLFAESGTLFHGGGYIAELTWTRRKSAGTLINLADLDWMDMRTRIIFFEMSAYNVNNNVFTAMTFVTEHLGSGLVLASRYIRSIVIQRESALIEVVYFLYSVVVLFKLLMFLNTVGPQVFFTSFWTLYDLFFVLIGLLYCVGYRIIMEIYSDYINEFQRSEKEVFFPFSGLFFIRTLDRYIMALLFIFATARSLRTFKYVSSIIQIKLRYTLYFAWPQILSMTFVLLMFMFSYQRLLEYLVNCLYPLGTSHWLQHKMNFLELQRAVVNPSAMFYAIIPCCLSCVGLVLYIMVLIESFSRANAVYVKIMRDKDF